MPRLELAEYVLISGPEDPPDQPPTHCSNCNCDCSSDCACSTEKEIPYGVTVEIVTEPWS